MSGGEPGHRRYRYRIDIDAYRPRTVDLPDRALTVRAPGRGDIDVLAALMLDAYRGTIDYEGEGMEEAVEAIEEVFAAEPMLSSSRLALREDGTAAGAVLSARYGDMPYISYVMTAASAKRRGLGRALVIDSLNRMKADGLSTVYLAITEGNVASETLFRPLGAYVDPDAVDR